jgi:hypothetical protein
MTNRFLPLAAPGTPPFVAVTADAPNGCTVKLICEINFPKVPS